EISLRRVVRPLPLQEHGLGAALAAHHANGLALYDLDSRVDAGAGAVAERVPNDLREMEYESVVALEAVGLDADDRSVFRYTDQEVTPLGIEERCDRLEHGVRDVVVRAPLPRTRAEARSELQRLGSAALDQLLGVAVGPEVQVEQVVLEDLPEHAVVSDLNRPGFESPRVCRRLQPLRDWGHETGKEVLPRGAGAGGSDGVRARERVLLAVGCHPVYCRKDRLLW